jgi:uncharacterized protein YjdB
MTAGEYEIRGELGRGGMAAVYLAYDLRLNRKVAIKVMLPELAYHDGMEERFRREARTAAKLEHPNIVVIYTVRDAGELMFFVMKYIDGAPLDALIRTNDRLPLPVARATLFQLCTALQFAHDENVVHRDVKPANVLIDNRGSVQVTDFGIAKVTESAHLTRTGTAIGTPAYMSPEQCLGQAQSAASDQYSVGVLAYELIAGRPPFAGAAVEIQWAHVREVPAPLIDLRPDCPPELSAAVMRMLEKNPTDRWPSLRDVLPILGSVADAEAARPALVELVKRSTKLPPPPFAVTPASPVPQRPETQRAPIRAIVVSPAAGTLEMGAKLQLEARWATGGTIDAGQVPVSWISSDPTRVSVSSGGLATGVSPGSAVVTAHFGTVIAACALVVEPARIASIEVAPRRCRVEVGATERITCLMRDARGGIVEGVPTWSSSDPAIATADDDGIVTARTLGKVTIAAMVGELADIASVEVVPDMVATVRVEPAILTLEERTTGRIHAEVANRRGRPIQGRLVAWMSADPAIATLDERGVVTTHRVGQTAVTATVDGTTGTGQVAVVPASVASVTITPSDAAVTVGDTVVFSALATDAHGFALESRPVKWQTSAAAIARVNAQGVVTARGEGVATISAEVDSVTTAASLTVARAPLARIDLGGPERTARVGKRVRLRPVGRDTQGATIAVADADWTSSDETIASVTRDGVVSALRPGTATITARFGQCESQIAVSVQPAAAGHGMRWVVAGAVAASLGAGAFLVARRATNRPVPEATPQPTADTPQVAVAPPPAPSAVPATPTAAVPSPVAKDRVDSARRLAESPGGRDTTIAFLQVTPDSPIVIEVGESVRLAGTALNRARDPLPRARLQWRAADGGIASVTAAGNVIGLRTGRTSVTVRSGSEAKVVDIQVREPAPGRVVATIGRDSLRVGESSSATARAYDRRGAVLNQRVVWSSSNPTVATVDDGGVVRAVGAGLATVVATAGSAADSVHVSVAAVPTAVATQSRANLPTARPESVLVPRVASQQPPTNPVSRDPDSTSGPGLRPPSETEARVIADSILQMIDRRQVGRFGRFGQSDAAKSRADFARFLERNHPSARLSGSPTVAAGKRGSARITLPVVLEWRTIGGRPNRSILIEFDVEGIANGGWSIREIGLPNGFTP